MSLRIKLKFNFKKITFICLTRLNISQELEQKKRDVSDLQIENEYLKLQITQRDQLIQVRN